MSKYLKDFETHSAYNTYITGNDKVLPNVSYCEDNNEVHYNPLVITKVSFAPCNNSFVIAMYDGKIIANIDGGRNSTVVGSIDSIQNMINNGYTFDSIVNDSSFVGPPLSVIRDANNNSISVDSAIYLNEVPLDSHLEIVQEPVYHY